MHDVLYVGMGPSDPNFRRCLLEVSHLFWNDDQEGTST